MLITCPGSRPSSARIRSRVGLRIAVLLSALGTAALPAQVAGAAPEAREFDRHRPPQGIVVDAGGLPIAGAEVSFRFETDNESARHWRNFILRTQPLPRVRTSHDGQFFLPLTRLHRLFTPESAGHISLVVEKAGFHPWVEPLAVGLRGYLGSRVTLHPIAAEERLRVEVVDPRPGMLLHVRRHSTHSVLTGHLAQDAWYPVPATGVVEAPVAFVPHPAVHAGTQLVQPIGIDLRLVFPGRTTLPRIVAPGARQVAFGDGGDGGNGGPRIEQVGSVTGPEGEAPAQLSGLYRCPDGENRWFPVDPAAVVESPLLPIVALHAPGYLALDLTHCDPSIERHRMRRLPATGGTRLRLRDSAGSPVLGAQAYFFDLADLPAPRSGNDVGAARARRRMSVEGDELPFDRSHLPGPGFFLIQAEGYAPAICVEPRGLTGQTSFDLGARRRTGAIDVTVLDDDGAPVAGALLCLQAPAFLLGSFNERLLCSDARGELRVPYLPAGSHPLLVVHEDFVTMSQTVAVRADQVSHVALTAQRAAVVRLCTQAEAGGPVAFQPVQVSYRTVQGGRVKVAKNEVFWSDSRGRLCLPEVAATGSAFVLDRGAAGAARRGLLFEPGDEVHQLPVVPTGMALLLLGEAPLLREISLTGGRSGSSSIRSEPGMRAALVRVPIEDAEVDISILFDGEAPMRVTTEALAAARRAMPAGARFPVLDQRRPTRRITFELTGVDGLDVDELRLELPGLNFLHGRPYVYEDSELRIRRDAAGAWTLDLRDGGAYEARLLHPDLLLADVPIPPAKAGAPASAVAVQLARGVPVRVRWKAARPPASSARMTLQIWRPDNQYEMYHNAPVGTALRAVGKDAYEFDAPYAIPPGKYQITVQCPGVRGNIKRQPFEAVAGTVLILDLTGPPAAAARAAKAAVARATALATALATKLEQTRAQLVELKAGAAKLEAAAPERRRAEQRAGLLEAQIKTLEAKIQDLLGKKGVPEGLKLERAQEPAAEPPHR